MEIKGIMKEIQRNLERRKEIRRAVATCYVKEALVRKNSGEKWAYLGEIAGLILFIKFFSFSMFNSSRS